MDMLAEQLEIVHGQWTESPFSFAGEHYRLEGLVAEPRPVQRPHPPLLMGGQAGPARGGARRSLGGRVQRRVRTVRRGHGAEGADRGGLRGRRAASRSRSR